MLKFKGAWRFDSPGAISSGVADDFLQLISKVAAQGNRWDIREHFKKYFAGAAGSSYYPSSNASWAETDLERHVKDAEANAPLFIEAFYDACEDLQRSHPNCVVPEASVINRILSRRNSGYQIHPPDLILLDDHEAIEVTHDPADLDEQAKDTIQESLREAEQLLSEGRNRPAVQELLWLLETVSTAFQGVGTDAGTVQGKYFNKIAADLRRKHRGKTLEQVLEWMTTVHGYLSSPTGGGIRHGASLNEGIAIQSHEARLFCNLIRSYIAYLIAEHKRMTAK